MIRIMFLVKPIKELIVLSVTLPKAYSEPSQTSKMEIFAKKKKNFILDVWVGSEYASDSLIVIFLS